MKYKDLWREFSQRIDNDSGRQETQPLSYHWERSEAQMLPIERTVRPLWKRAFGIEFYSPSDPNDLPTAEPDRHWQPNRAIEDCAEDHAALAALLLLL